MQTIEEEIVHVLADVHVVRCDIEGCTNVVRSERYRSHAADTNKLATNPPSLTGWIEIDVEAHPSLEQTPESDTRTSFHICPKHLSDGWETTETILNNLPSVLHGFLRKVEFFKEHDSKPEQDTLSSSDQQTNGTE